LHGQNEAVDKDPVYLDRPDTVPHMDSGGWSAVADASIQVFFTSSPLPTKIVPSSSLSWRSSPWNWSVVRVSCFVYSFRVSLSDLRSALELELGIWAWHLGLSLALGLKLGTWV
jgi:hypothetical protein